ncbi:MAG: hypothetical protein KDK25_04290 [Leptospiraceae bacterium]|nr:hypothetical protein [Leptospiraceae bacterium]
MSYQKNRLWPFAPVLLLVLPSLLAAEGNQKLKMRFGTEIWPYYEMLDRQPTGPDSAGSDSEDTGFSLGRARVDMRGRFYEGDKKGIGFRFTMEQEFNPPDSCSGYNCAKDNPYYAKMKFVFVDVPVTDWMSIRIGQQHTPVVDTQSDVSLQDLWGHRYIAKAPWDDFGVSPSTERGISAIVDFDYFSMQLLLSNGEGIDATNAQSRLRNFTTPSSVLESMSAGVNSTYGLDFTGMLSFSPLGKKGTHRVHINTPFRLENVVGLSGQDTSLPAMDGCSDAITMVAQGPTPSSTCANIVSTLRPAIYKGQQRAMKDYATGLELDYEYKGQGVESTLGLGYIQKVDRRGVAYRIRPDITLTNSFSDLANNYLAEEDRRGDMIYLFWHGRYRDLGAFVRFAQGDGKGTTSNDLTASDNRDYWRQLLALDAADDQIGNLTYAEALNVNFNRASFREWIAGFTFFVHESFRVSVGWSLITATDSRGGPARVSSLDAYTLPGGKTLSETLGSSSTYSQIPQFYQNLGYTSSSGFRIQDYAGSRARNEQIFIRASFDLNGGFTVD